MYTELVEEVGHIYSIQEATREGLSYRWFRIVCKKIRKGMRLGGHIVTGHIIREKNYGGV